MIDDLIRVLTLVSALGCGLMAGFFFAFSACVMNALARLPASGGIAAMQAINSIFLPAGSLDVSSQFLDILLPALDMA